MGIQNKGKLDKLIEDMTKDQEEANRKNHKNLYTYYKRNPEIYENRMMRLKEIFGTDNAKEIQRIFANLSAQLGIAGMGTTIASVAASTAVFFATMFSGIKHVLTGPKIDDYITKARGEVERATDDLKADLRQPLQKQPA